MAAITLPTRRTMLRAFTARDAAFDGVFYTAVRTTGVFCRPTCPARKPRPQHVEFFPSAREALLAGFRPCKRCRPLEPRGAAPAWLRPLLDDVDAAVPRRWTDADVRGLGLAPSRVRRWFQTHLAMTFHAYVRARRLSAALGRIRNGDTVTNAAFATGYESLSGFDDAFRDLFGTTATGARDAPAFHVARLPTPLGPMLAAASDQALYLLEFVDRRMIETQLKRLQARTGCLYAPGGGPVIERAARELEQYFAGRLREFSVPLAAPGTPFQRAVWDELRKIPYGTTTSYREVARRIGRPAAVRAVARANGDNRLAIVIPCHRVVGADGKLSGYGGGVWRKRRLLAIETAGSALEAAAG